MNKSVLSFTQYLIKEDEVSGATGTPVNVTTDTRPETERETKSRIAAGLVKGLFGGVEGLTGSVDSQIEITPEVKESRPYRGCGASEPFRLEKTPIPLKAFKIILNYLQEKGVGDYSRVIKELNEKRAVLIGVRNNLSVKKESANQDRFTDALYFIPGNANDGGGATGSLALNTQKPNESRILSFSSFSKIYEKEGEDKFKNTRDLSATKFSISETGPNNPTGATIPAATGTALGVTGAATGLVPDNANLGDRFVPYQITTVPSLAYYGKKPLNPKGTGIKLPGDTVYYLKEGELGHGKYKMFVEGEKIKVGRYPVGVTTFETYKPAEVFTEDCGMQIHRSSTNGVGICVGPWSAGCQVFADYDEFKDVISKAEREQMNAGKFLYALIQLDDIDPKVLQDAMNGISPQDSTIQSGTGATGSEDLESEEEGTGSTAANQTETMDSENLIKIKDLVKFIKDELSKTNSDEDSTIKKYNSVIKSDSDWKKLEKQYGSSLWSDLDSFLDSDELSQLKFRNTKALE